MIWIFLIIYFLGMFGIGLWYSRRQTSVAEFVAADHGLGYWIASFSARATGESGWLILGLSGMGWLIGTPALWVVLGEVLGVAVSWLLIVPEFKREVMKHRSLTMLDYFEERLGDSRHWLRIVFSGIILVMVSFYVAGQFSATGTGFSAFFEMDRHTGMLIGAGIVLVYVSLGGFRAVAVSDFIQGVLMFIGLVAIPVAGLIAAGGWEPVAETARNAGLLSWYPDREIAAAGGIAIPTTGWAVLLGVGGMMATGLGFLGSPQVYQRIIALDGTRDIGKAAMVAILYTAITGSAAVMSGVVGKFFFAELANPETVYPDLVQQLFPPLISGLFLAIILSAIMSTADSLLIMASTTLVFDLFKKVFHPGLSEKSAIRGLRLVTVVVCAIGLAVAWEDTQSIYFLVLFAWAGLACAFCPTLIMTLFWKRTTTAGVLAGAIAGFGTALWWKMAAIGYVYEMVPGFVAGFAATALFSLAFPSADIQD